MVGMRPLKKTSKTILGFDASVVTATLNYSKKTHVC